MPVKTLPSRNFFYAKRLIPVFIVSGSKNGLNGHVHSNHHIHSNHHVTHHHNNHSHHNHHSWCYVAPCPVASPSSSSSLPAGNHSNRPTDPFSQSLFSPRQQHQQQQQLQLPGNHWQQHDHGCYDSYRDDNDQYRAQRPGAVTGRYYDNRPRRAESSNQRWRAESPRARDAERGVNRNQFNTNFRSSGGSTYQRRERYTNPPSGPQRDRYSNNSTVPPASSYRCRSAPPGGGFMSQAHFINSSLQQSMSFRHSASATTAAAAAASHHQGAAPPAAAHRQRSSSNQRLSAPVYSSQSGWPTVTSLAAGGGSGSSRRHGNSYHHHRSDSNDYEPCWCLCAHSPVAMVKCVVSAFCALMGFSKIKLNCTK